MTRSPSISAQRNVQQGSRPLTRRSALAECAARLTAAGVSNAAQEATWLLEAALGLDSLRLHLDPDVPVSSAERRRLEELCRRRVGREPLQYLLGTQEFCGLEFLVARGVLIPRPETELLVEEVIEQCRGLEAPRILEVGTGSGCIAVSLAVRLPRARLYATDVSPEALRLATRNADRHGVSGRIHLVRADLISAMKPAGRIAARIAAIVSNPPYIPDEALADLQPEVRFEPGLALAGGPDGLQYHRRLIAEGARMLGPGGLLTLEVGVGQATEVASNILRSGLYNAPRIRRDAAGIERVVSATRA